MIKHRSFRKAGVCVTALCACTIATSSGAAAQGRFDLLEGDSIAAVQGLNVYTVRDRRTAVPGKKNAPIPWRTRTANTVSSSRSVLAVTIRSSRPIE